MVRTQASVALRSGDAAHAPRGQVHTIEVTGDGPARWLVLSSLAGFEAFVRAVGVPAPRRELPFLDAPPDVDRRVRIAGEHGIRLVGPPGARPADLVAAGA